MGVDAEVQGWDSIRTGKGIFTVLMEYLTDNETTLRTRFPQKSSNCDVTDL
jgi:hypothetical protein